MKHLRILATMLFLSFLTVGFIACETDGGTCNKTNKCLNDGVCIDGDCHCPKGYYGDYCENSLQATNPCRNVTCLNGGTCIDGDCDCPTGYYGDKCQYTIGVEDGESVPTAEEECRQSDR